MLRLTAALKSAFTRPHVCMQDLLKAAERFQSMLAVGPISAKEAADAAHKDWAALSANVVKAEAASSGGDRHVAAAELAAGWSRAAAAHNALLASNSYATAGLAASVLVCSSPGSALLCLCELNFINSPDPAAHKSPLQGCLQQRCCHGTEGLSQGITCQAQMNQMQHFMLKSSDSGWLH